MASDAIVVALDAAATKLANIGIKPDIIIGDFDSIGPAANIWGIRATKTPQHDLELHTKLFSTPYLGNFAIMLVPAQQQNFTDLHKALVFLTHHVHKYYDYPRPSVINIATTAAPRLDHALANILTLKQAYNADLAIYLHEEYQSLEYVEDKIININGLVGDYCGIFGLPAAQMTVINGGLAYANLAPYQLSLQQYSVANRLIRESATIAISGQALIAHPPQYQAQRQFFHKSRQEQLQEQLNDNNRLLHIAKAATCYPVINASQLDILCVSHSVTHLSSLNNSKVLLSIPLSQYQTFLNMLPAEERVL
jgi:thiamine pyrophosphokinase